MPPPGGHNGKTRRKGGQPAAHRRPSGTRAAEGGDEGKSSMPARGKYDPVNSTPNDLEYRVLAALAQAGEPTKPRELISQLKEETGQPEPAILNAIWRLVERRLVELTADLRFRAIRDAVPT